ncbi:rhomboid family intramembrane serine protease [Pseudomonas sp.]|uniref:rhomboid family intramembrane serine protease n=1 Tax=Pseudomonas sp. TaxID=306 RepID=UPI0026363E8A|nr:rhomboid family intramembrane serine protease [Pseudomonas sp.]
MIAGNGLRIILGLAAVMVLVQLVNSLTANSLLHFGLIPRTLYGLQGIVFAPFLHGSVRHLLSNLLPFIVLSWLVATGGVQRYVRVAMLVALLGGLMVWVIGRPVIHVGASGVIFGLWAYLLARAWYQRSLVSFAVALITLLGYSGLIFGFIPVPGVSIESHLSGALAGIVVAWLMHSKGLVQKSSV